ncbi:MAG: di-trans,poly-cis-decaprenylcistransferase [Proteobacteria bacterium]|nr:di-trans,poly-cis-decaprenylcistransferase [Pseudomonadota bacterium]NOG60817.1 di-trans,poly-cis-decaprenylcistransferase [Pseudomonadota bacterium]
MDIDSKPNHIAIIMDGNGRWAKNKSLPRVAGHRAGVKTLRKLIEHAVRIDLSTLTAYAFSRENWQRPKKEVDLLMDLFMTALQSEVKDLHENNVCLKFIGDKAAFSDKLQETIVQSEALTSTNSGLNLNIAANYSGRWDITQATQAIATEIALGNLNAEDVNESLVNSKVCLTENNDPDLFIRTGGERRISNYFLWQLAYTELYFTDILWPDFVPEELDKAIEWFASRQRRFGKTSEQIDESKN